MCNATALIATAAIGGAVFTGGTSLYGLAGSATTGGTLAGYAGLAAAGIAATSAYQQAKTNKQVAENNARTAEIKAQSDYADAQKQAIQVQQRGSVLEGSQRAAMSARGLDLSDGTPADILGQTSFFTQSDVATTRNNGARAAWADRAQESGFQLQADGQNPGLTLAGSLLGGGATLLAGNQTVASRWYQYNK